MRQTIDPQRSGSYVAKRNYGGTSPATVLAWIIASLAIFGGWLVFTFGHYFGPSQFPEQNPVPQGVTFVDSHSGVVRSVAQGHRDNRG